MFWKLLDFQLFMHLFCRLLGCEKKQEKIRERNRERRVSEKYENPEIGICNFHSNSEFVCRGRRSILTESRKVSVPIFFFLFSACKFTLCV